MSDNFNSYPKLNNNVNNVNTTNNVNYFKNEVAGFNSSTTNNNSNNNINSNGDQSNENSMDCDDNVANNNYHDNGIPYFYPEVKSKFLPFESDDRHPSKITKSNRLEVKTNQNVIDHYNMDLTSESGNVITPINRINGKASPSSADNLGYRSSVHEFGYKPDENMSRERLHHLRIQTGNKFFDPERSHRVINLTNGRVEYAGRSFRRSDIELVQSNKDYALYEISETVSSQGLMKIYVDRELIHQKVQAAGAKDWFIWLDLKSSDCKFINIQKITNEGQKRHFQLPENGVYCSFSPGQFSYKILAFKNFEGKKYIFTDQVQECILLIIFDHNTQRGLMAHLPIDLPIEELSKKLKPVLLQANIRSKTFTVVGNLSICNSSNNIIN